MIASTSVFLILSFALAVAAAVRHSAAGSRARTTRFAAGDIAAASEVAVASDEAADIQPDAHIYFLDVYRAARASMRDESGARDRHSPPTLRSVSLGSGTSGSALSERPRPA